MADPYCVDISSSSPIDISSSDDDDDDGIIISNALASENRLEAECVPALGVDSFFDLWALEVPLQLVRLIILIQHTFQAVLVRCQCSIGKTALL